ncbi:MAG: 30S ribosomal protein S2 [Patescibacteria group bacterium]|nr:30S ribosomal protein S2 [Patescibacteria group bacterium]
MSKKTVLELPSIQKLLEEGVHFGHSPRRWNPKNKQYILKKVRGTHILDPRETLESLKEAVEFLNKVSREGGTVLFVGLKRQSRDLVAKYAEEVGVPCMAGRWVGGLLTNFFEVKKNVSKLKELEEGLARGEFDHYTKKERLDIRRDVEKLDRDFGGVRGLGDMPAAVVVCSTRKGGTAVEEAQKLDIPVVGVVDTDADPRIDFPIPANDDSIRSLSLLLPILFEAVKLGREGKEIDVKVGKSRGKEENGKEKKEVSKESESLEGLDLGARATNALKKAGLGVEDLRDMSRDALTNVKGIGKKTAEKIKQAL